MKHLLLIGLIFPLLVFSQSEGLNRDTFKENLDVIIKVDNQIYLCDNQIHFLKKEEDTIVAENLIDLAKSLLNIMDLKNKENFVIQLDMISHVETITWLELVFKDSMNFIDAKLETQSSEVRANITLFKELYHLLEVKLLSLMEREFTFYSFNNSSDKKIKYMYVDHGNDFFHVLGRYNDDRDMTGSFRIEVGTDLFKLRVFNSDVFFNSRNWYSYQTLFVGGEGYTPYLRDTSIFNSPTSVDSNDRPYASIIYAGRAKHRVHRLGKIRVFSQIKLGQIGSKSPEGVQSIIHRDLTISSFKPNGWQRQIANGGRLAFSYEFSHEIMLISKNWLLTNSITTKTKFRGSSAINLSLFDEFKIGHDMTSAGIGLNFSTLDFKTGGGLNVPFSNRYKENSRGLLNYFTVNGKILYRYVFHNSMLEGYGILKHSPDESPDSPVDEYRLSLDEQINRNVFIFELSLNLKLNKVGIFFSQTFMSPEFDLPVNSMEYANAFTTGKGNHNRSPWNHYGKVGIIFKM